MKTDKFCYEKNVFELDHCLAIQNLAENASSMAFNAFFFLFYLTFPRE